MTDIDRTRRRRTIPNDAVDWDDRKTILDVFHEAAEGHVTLLGEMDHISSALLAVARWGAAQAVEVMEGDIEVLESRLEDARQRARPREH